MADDAKTQLAAIQQAIRIMDDSSSDRLRAILGATKIHDHLKDDPTELRRKLVDATEEHHHGAFIAARQIIEAAEPAKPVYPAPGSDIPPEENFGMPGYVVGECGHRVAGSEWRVGLHNCERCVG